MKLYLLPLTILLATLVSSTPIDPRAGAPTAKPIPSKCTQINPLPNARSDSDTCTLDGFMPDPDFTSANLVYQSYFLQPWKTEAELIQQCFEQCYGYGYGNECISAMLGHDIPVPQGWMESKGGTLMTGCIMFREFLDSGVFIEAPEGQYVNLTAVDISCPE